LDHVVSLVESQLYKKHIAKVNSMFEAINNFLRELVQFTEAYPDYIAIYCDLGSSSMNKFAVISSDKFRKATSTYTVKMVEEAMKREEIDSNIKSEAAAYMIDSYITLFAYSLVSEYHSNRFNSFFLSEGERISKEKIVDLIIDTLKQALKN
jgi:TetR/AcrR family transcriptional regulator